MKTVLWILVLLMISVASCREDDDGRGGPIVEDTTVDSTGGQNTGGTGDADADADADADSDTDADADTDSGLEECNTVLTAVVRDFSAEHPDFESFCCNLSPGIVAPELGADGKPVFSPTYLTSARRPMVSGAESFAEWYNTIDGVNYEFQTEIPLDEISPGVYDYDNSDFFPLGDDQGFGLEGNNRNFFFTTEMHLNFVYKAGQVFMFTGDDDLFVFINGKLELDLGGVHEAVDGEIELDAVAASQGLIEGETYSMDIFHAERHTTESNFHIQTTIDCFKPGVLVK